MEICFIVLSTDKNTRTLKATCNSLQFHNQHKICIVNNDIDKIKLKEFKEYCPTYVGENTWASLINTGIKNTKYDWNIFVVSGSRISKSTIVKLNTFCKNDKDIIFPITDFKMNFVEGSINGLLINKNTFQEVGEFSTSLKEFCFLTKKGKFNEFELVKSLWGASAVEKGCRFKGVVGLNIL